MKTTDASPPVLDESTAERLFGDDVFPTLEPPPYGLARLRSRLRGRPATRTLLRVLMPATGVGVAALVVWIGAHTAARPASTNDVQRALAALETSGRASASHPRIVVTGVGGTLRSEPHDLGRATFFWLPPIAPDEPAAARAEVPAE